jgi:hypothetical protein
MRQCHPRLIFSDGNFDSDAVHGEQEGDNVDSNWTFVANYFSTEPHLLTQVYLKEFIRDLNVLKNKAEVPSCRLKG